VDGPRAQLNLFLQNLNIFGGKVTFDTDGRLVLARKTRNPKRHDHRSSALKVVSEYLRANPLPP